MSATLRSRSGAQMLVDALRINGIDTVFGVPGESYLHALDALYEQRGSVRYVTCRHEGGAAYMAEAYGRLTGRPGACFVTRGPGATNAAIGVHTAQQASTPMLLLVGQVPRRHLGREAFQEVDYRLMFRPLCKWVDQVEDPARMPELVTRALRAATAGRGGPAVLGLPEDVLAESARVPDLAAVQPVQPHPGAADLHRLRAMIEGAERPVLILGGGGWTQEACTRVLDWAAACDLPLAATFRHQDLVNNTHRCYVGDVGLGVFPALAGRIRAADLLVVIGARLDEASSLHYTLVEAPLPRQRLAHVHPGAEELGRVYQAELLINAGVACFAAALQALPPVSPSPWSGWREEARRDYLESLEPPPQPGALDMGRVMVHLREQLPADAILASGAGNFAEWPSKFYPYRRYGTILGPVSGAMGYGVPAAVAAKIAHPERVVVAFAGDGDFLMNGQELATAVQHGLDPVVLVVNNGLYGTIRAHQERRFPGRVHGTALNNPDFAAWARSFGAFGEVVTRTEEFPDAFGRALGAGTAAVLELRIDPEGISARSRLSELGRG